MPSLVKISERCTVTLIHVKCHAVAVIVQQWCIRVFWFYSDTFGRELRHDHMHKNHGIETDFAPRISVFRVLRYVLVLKTNVSR